jgi:DNA polymerase-3 subunit beta
MRVRLDHAEFTAAVAWVSRALAARPYHPILAGILLDAQGDTLRMSAYDQDTAATITLPALDAQPGRALVSGALLGTIAKLLPARPVDLTADPARLELACGPARATLPLLPVQDYPALPAPPDCLGEVDTDVFARAVGQVSLAAADEADTTVGGVLIEASPDGPLRLVATDRYRLVIRDLPWQPTLDLPTGGMTLRVAARTLDGLARHLASTGHTTVRLHGDDRGCGLSAGTHQATLRTLDGPFAAYRTRLPSQFTATATAPVDLLIAAVKRAAVFAQRGTQIVFDFTPGQVQLTAGHHDDANGSETLTLDYTGAPLTVAFNPTYLLDALGTTGTDLVQIRLTSTQQPAVLYPVNPAGEIAAEHYHLVMPLRLPGSPTTTPSQAAA